jgi:hypothetical protein
MHVVRIQRQQAISKSLELHERAMTPPGATIEVGVVGNDGIAGI